MRWRGDNSLILHTGSQEVFPKFRLKNSSPQSYRQPIVDLNLIKIQKVSIKTSQEESLKEMQVQTLCTITVVLTRSKKMNFLKTVMSALKGQHKGSPWWHNSSVSCLNQCQHAGCGFVLRYHKVPSIGHNSNTKLSKKVILRIIFLILPSLKILFFTSFTEVQLTNKILRYLKCTM